jgi:hypothetical protein
MKHSVLFRFTQVAIVSAGLAVVPLASLVYGQTSTSDRGTTETPRVQQTRVEQPFNWGLLGLLGLAGLLSPMFRNDRARNHVAVDTAGRPTHRT